MTIDKIIENFFWCDGNINIKNPKKEEEIKKVLNDKFGKTDIKFYNDCEDLISSVSVESQYNGFVAGFKHGFECAKSLNAFLK